MRNSRKLRHAYGELEGANAAIEAQKAHIEEQAAGLAAVNATKDRLFSILAHDLRSPVATLRGALELGLQGKVGPDAFMALLPNLHRSVVGMQVILENLLHWSLAQVRGGTRGNAVSFPLEAIIEENVLLLSETARAKQIRLESRIPAGLHVFADRDQLSLVVRNLVSNSLKFTPSGGQVLLLAEEKEGFVQVGVQDNGVGMTAAQISSLFVGSGNASTRGTGGEKGTGLGLLLCKELVTANGGTIWAESTPGEGSLFQFLIPVATELPPLHEIR
jgi:signal transduction histidine kinase